MTSVAGTAPAGPAGEPISVVQSLRMRFEQGTQREGGTNKPRFGAAEFKTMESIQKFESLSRKNPGQQLFQEAFSRSLSKSASGKCSIRVGSLRHKFESLANRSLSSDVFNGPSKDQDNQQNDSSTNLNPMFDRPESEVSQEALPEDAAIPPASSVGEAEVSNQVETSDGRHEAVLDLIEPEAILQGEPAVSVINSNDMSLVSFSSEDSFDNTARAICLKDEIKDAEARSENLELPDAQTEAPEIVEDHVYGHLIDSTVDAAKVPAEEPEEIDQNIIQAPAVSGLSDPSALVAAQDDVKDAIPDERSSADHEDTAMVPVVEAEAATDVVPGSFGEVDNEREEIPMQRRQPHSHKRRGLFHRLLTCGTTI